MIPGILCKTPQHYLIQVLLIVHEYQLENQGNKPVRTAGESDQSFRYQRPRYKTWQSYKEEPFFQYLRRFPNPAPPLSGPSRTPSGPEFRLQECLRHSFRALAAFGQRSLSQNRSRLQRHGKCHVCHKPCGPENCGIQKTSGVSCSARERPGCFLIMYGDCFSLKKKV